MIGKSLGRRLLPDVLLILLVLGYAAPLVGAVDPSPDGWAPLAWAQYLLVAALAALVFRAAAGEAGLQVPRLRLVAVGALAVVFLSLLAHRHDPFFWDAATTSARATLVREGQGLVGGRERFSLFYHFIALLQTVAGPSAAAARSGLAAVGTAGLVGVGVLGRAAWRPDRRPGRGRPGRQRARPLRHAALAVHRHGPAGGLRRVAAAVRPDLVPSAAQPGGGLPGAGRGGAADQGVRGPGPAGLPGAGLGARQRGPGAGAPPPARPRRGDGGRGGDRLGSLALLPALLARPVPGRRALLGVLAPADRPRASLPALGRPAAHRPGSGPTTRGAVRRGRGCWGSRCWAWSRWCPGAVRPPGSCWPGQPCLRPGPTSR